MLLSEVQSFHIIIIHIWFISDDNPVVPANDSMPEDDEDPIQKYKKLLEEIDKKEESKKNKDMEMEITWGLGVKDKAEELVKKKMTQGEKNFIF